MSDWNVVVLKGAGFTPLGSAMTRKGRFPAADYGTRCVCCDQETETRLSFDPSARHSASEIALPRCEACAPHVARGNTAPMIYLGALGVGLVLVAMGANNGWWPVLGLGVLAFAAGGAYAWRTLAKRAAMRTQGHHVGLEIVAIPGLVSVRTTNPRFASELCSRNPQLAHRRR